MSYLSLLTGNYKKVTPANAVFVETTEYEKGFAEHYKKNIKPFVEDFEKLRMSALDKASLRTRIAVPVVALVLILMYFYASSHKVTNEETKTLMAIALFVVGGAGLWIYSSIGKYKSSIKGIIFPQILSFLGGYKYAPKIAPRGHQYKDWDILPSYDRERSEDEIKGNHKGVAIDFFETNLEERRSDGKGRTYYKVIFKGLLISLTIHKHFKGKTILKKDGGIIGNWFATTFSHLENVKLEDPRFEKLFEAYANDQIEARYLLTTAFMDRLVRLVEVLGSKAVQCSFYRDSLLMMIPVKKDMFEPGDIFVAEDFVDDSKQFLYEMNLIHQIIETLKLDQNIGM